MGRSIYAAFCKASTILLALFVLLTAPHLRSGLAMAAAPPAEQVPFLVLLHSQAPVDAAASAVQARSAGLSERSRVQAVRQAVTTSLMETATASQAPVLDVVARLRAEGHISASQSLWVVNALAVTGDRTAMEQLAALPEVASVREDRRIPLALPPAETPASPQSQTDDWNLTAVGAQAAWAKGATGDGVVIASLDTGVEWSHPALRTQFRGYDPANPGTPVTTGNWYDVVTGSTSPFDDVGHGTHTTGTMIGYDPAEGIRTGVAPGAKWIAVKAFDRIGAYDSWLLRAGQWLLAPTDAGGTPHPEWAPDIINNSWGGSPGMDEFYRNMVRSWRAAGILPVFSAGNDGPGAATVSPPGNYPEAFTVGAVDPGSGLAYYSSRGPAPYANLLKPNLVAPGTGVYSTLPGQYYGYKSGTSMAAPHVAGAAALLLSVAPTLTPAQVEEKLQVTATPRTDTDYPTAPNLGYGHGLLNIPAALDATAPLGSLSGVVRNSVTGAPVPAFITLTPGAIWTTTSPGDGSYTVSAYSRTYRMEVRAPGYTKFTRDVFVAPGGTRVDVDLVPIPRGIVTGRVTEAGSAYPVAGAAVYVVGDGVAERTETDRDGRYQLEAMAGNHTLWVRAPGFDPAKVPVSITGPQAAVTKDVSLTLAPDNSGEWLQDGGNTGRTYATDALLGPPYQFAWSVGYSLKSPIISGGRVFGLTHYNSRLVALSAAAGSELWRCESNTLTPPVIMDGRIYVGSAAGQLWSINAATGSSTALPVEGTGAVTALAAGQKQLFVVKENTLFALDEQGAPLWKRSLIAPGRLTAGTDHVYVTGFAGVTAYDIQTGVYQWSWNAGRGIPQGTLPVVSGDRLVMLDENWTLHAVDTRTGVTRWTYPDVIGHVAVWDGSVYAGTTDGRVKQLRLADGYLLRMYSAYTATATYPKTHLPVIADGLLFMDPPRAVDLQTGDVLWSKTEGPEDSTVGRIVVGENLVLIPGAVTSVWRPTTPVTPGRLAGHVTDRATGQVIPGATIRLAGTGRMAETGGSGAYSLRAAPGTYAAVVRAKGYGEFQSSVTVTAGGTATLDIPLDASGEGTLAGQLIDAATGLPLQGAIGTVLEDPTVPAMVTDENGRFRLSAYSGQYTLRVTAPLYPTTDLSITVAASGEASATFSIDAGRPSPADWPNSRGPAAGTGQSASLLAPPLEVAWRTGTETYSKSIVAGGKLFAISAQGALRAFDLQTGTLLWQQSSKPGSALAYDRGVVYATQQTQLVSAFDANTGRLRWSILYKTDEITVKNGLILTNPTALMDAETGKSSGAFNYSSRPNTAAISDGVAYVAGLYRSYAIDLATRRVVWTNSACCSETTKGPTVVAYGLVFGLNYGRLIAMDAATGLVRWSVPDAVAAPVAGDGVIFVRGPAGVRALDPANGRTLYTVPTLAGIGAYANGHLYGENVTVFDVVSRSVVGSYLPGSSVTAVTADRVVAQRLDGELVVLRPVTSPPEAGTLRGRVMGGPLGDTPLKATVTVAGGQAIQTERDGTFALYLPAGTYTLTIDADRWQPLVTQVTLESGTEVGQAFSLEPDPRGQVSGLILDSLTGEPVPGVSVTVAEDLAVAKSVTGSTGSYLLRPLPGTYTLRFEAAGYQLAHRSVAVSLDQPLVVDAELEPGPVSDCRQERCGPSRTGLQPIGTAPPLAEAWRTLLIPRMGSFRPQPVTAKGIVVAGARNGSVIALNLYTGKTLWVQHVNTLNDFPPNSLLIGGETVFAYDGGQIYAFDLYTGRLLWSSWIAASQLAYGNGLLYATSFNYGATLWALDPATGRGVWTAAWPGQTSVLTIGGGRIYATTYGPRVYAFDGATGAQLWTADESQGYSGSEDSEILYADDVLLVKPKYRPDLFAYNAVTGAKLWQTTAGIPAVAGTTVYAMRGISTVALDLHTGSELWSLPVAGNDATLPPVLNGKYLLLGPLMIDTETRQVVVTLPYGSDIAPVPAEGFLLVTGSDGYLKALRTALQVRVPVQLEHRSDLSDVTVTLSREGTTYATETAADGLATFVGVPPGTYTLTCRRSLYLAYSRQVALTSSGQLEPVQLLAGDVDQDGAIGLSDLHALLVYWGTANPEPDLVPDGTFDLKDLQAVTRNWGAQAPQ